MSVKFDVNNVEELAISVEDYPESPRRVRSAKSVQFVVDKVEDQDSIVSDEEVKNVDTDVSKGASTVQYSEDGGDFALYAEELDKRPRIAQLLSKLVLYEPVPDNPNKSDDVEKGAKKKKKKKKEAKMGVIIGVYLPTLQNILGLILFLRLTWIVGTAGVGQAFLIVFLCCCCTMLTAISMSAIATNGVVPAGGSYFMISRNLGPEFGGAVGILFYLGTSFAVSLYVLGAIELLLIYIVPEMSLFGEVRGNPSVLYNNMRVYGTILLILLSLIVLVGVRYVNYFATCALVCVLVAVVSIYAGILSSRTHLCVCTLDGIVLEGASEMYQCPDAKDRRCETPLFNISNSNDSSVASGHCSPDNLELLKEFRGSRFVLVDDDNATVNDNVTVNSRFVIDDDNATLRWTSVEPQCSIGIPGLTKTSTISDNTDSNYLEQGEVRPGENGVEPQVSAQVASSFFILIGIFFPSVTGIMAGSNRSGDLKDAQKSIPIGTIAAILTTSTIYLTCVLFFGGSVAGFVLRDQFGDSIGGLVVAELAWPINWIILIGGLLSTVGAGLQSLTGAPRLLQAIAKDDLIFFLKLFGRSLVGGEPTYALILTFILSECGVLIASVDAVAPILTMFFLMCYMFVNLATALQSLLRAPNWRPRFRYYHWTLSVAGAILCLAIMFISSWYYALIALFIAVVIHQYIAFRGAEKEWGDGIKGLSLQLARYALLQLEERPLHAKNWRPQLLVLCKLHPESLIPYHPKLLSFASQLKAGQGLTMVSSVLQGEYTESVSQVKAAKETLKKFVDDCKIQGFCEVLAAPDVTASVAQTIQGSGLGGLKPNTVLLAWPDSWKKKQSWKTFIRTVRAVMAAEKAMIVTKGIDWFPSNEDKWSGNIDIWWVVHDGGLLMLLPFLLRQHKVWKHCNLRIFTVAQMEDNSVQMKRDLRTFIYQLRISAEVDVIEMPDSDISAYTYERTLLMEERSKMLHDLRLSKRKKRGDIQHVMSLHHQSSTISAAVLNRQGTISESDEEDGGRPSQLPITPPPSTPVITADTLARFTAATSGIMEPTSPTDQNFHEENVRRMNTSVKLNELIVNKSRDARLVLLNLPAPPHHLEHEDNYMEFLDVLTEGLQSVLMVRGGGREVITIYS